MDPLTIAVLLLLLGLGLAAAEVFVPSGGLLGLISAAVIVGSVASAWSYDPAWGASMLLAAALMVPVVVVVGFRVFPQTPIGRRMILSSPIDDGVPTGDAARPVSAAEANGVEVGTQGCAGTDLRPSGTAFFGSHRVDVVTVGEWIERGAVVRAVEVEGNRVVVEAVG